jgi:hypothetical protein
VRSNTFMDSGPRFGVFASILLVISACSSQAPTPRSKSAGVVQPEARTPAYSAQTIVPNGARDPGPLAPGMIASIYGERLGPDTPCSGSPVPGKLEAPNPLRPNQTTIERQAFPERLCETEVRVGGRPAGLLYVSARQINFNVPQQTAIEGTVEIQVSYSGRSGNAVTVPLFTPPESYLSEGLAEEIWLRLQTVRWNRAYRERDTCTAVTPHQSLRSGLHDYAYYCAEEKSGVIRESLYYPADGDSPAILLRRADLRLANAYPEVSAEVEQALIRRFTRAYGAGATPDHIYEIGATRPSPGLSWQAGPITIFLHRNRNYVHPAGVREGVLVIAVRREVLSDRQEMLDIQREFGSSTNLSYPVIAAELKRDLGDSYVVPAERPSTEAHRVAAERTVRTALLRLLRDSRLGDNARRAAVLVAADDLTVRLGGLLISRSIGKGGEILLEASNAGSVRKQLAVYNVQYTGPGHYSGDLEHDRSLLERAWKEFPETPWGQRAFLMLQRTGCAPSRFECDGPNCFRAVIEQGEKFLRDYPDTPFRREQLYHLAVAKETWWSLSQAASDDATAEGAKVDRASGERARVKAIELYEQLTEIAAGSAEARAAKLALQRLKLRLGTGERTFFCFHC